MTFISSPKPCNCHLLNAVITEKPEIISITVNFYFRLPQKSVDSEKKHRKQRETFKKKMVAISLYRGNLHRAPEVSRRWLMPTPKISLKDFKSLLHRRGKALSRLRASSSSNPNPNPVLKHQIQSSVSCEPPIEPKLKAKLEPEPSEGLKTGKPLKEVKVDIVVGSDGGDCLVKSEDEQTEKDVNLQVDEKPPEEAKTNVEVL